MRVRPRKRRPLVISNKIGQQMGKGPLRNDAVSGWPFPKAEMVKQRGRLVSARPRDGSLDSPDKSP